MQTALLSSRNSQADAHSEGAHVVDGLTAFAPIWGIASLFSIAGDLGVLRLNAGVIPFVLGWAAALCAASLIVKPRRSELLWLLAGLMACRYMVALPVASNNKTIAFFMNVAILVIAMHAMSGGAASQALRQVTYDRMRIVARGLLAVMYFFGIFHKINADFFDLQASCAVALYRPLASGFGLADNPYGHHLAIWSTMIVESITLVALYWKRYFAVGLLAGLAFHFVIPISGFSWYMDFSSLVLALYVLSIPSEVSQQFYNTCAGSFRALRTRLGELGTLLPFIAGALAVAALATLLLLANPDPRRAAWHLYWSFWMLSWVVYGGITMILLSKIALDHLPWRGTPGARPPLWVYVFPATLFLTCLSPYVGLKTESSIAMFSNLHTEGGTTNHFLFAKPPYLFPYQSQVAELVASSDRKLQNLADRRQGMVLFALKEYLRKNPGQWVSYRLDGVLHENVTAQSFAPADGANWLERHLLIFKTVDRARPKVCTH